ncbi:hypothetical protein Efla_002683 [Eimeria flavescens]
MSFIKFGTQKRLPEHALHDNRSRREVQPLFGAKKKADDLPPCSNSKAALLLRESQTAVHSRWGSAAKTYHMLSALASAN